MSVGKRNRTSGHAWEREVVKQLKAIGFPHVCTSRSESRSRDDQKVDILNKDEAENGRLPYNIQAKCVKGNLNYLEVLDELPDTPNVINVIFHKRTEKVGKKFLTRGNFAILYLEDFLEMARRLEEYEQKYDRGELVESTPRGVSETLHAPAKRNTKRRVQ